MTVSYRVDIARTRERIKKLRAYMDTSVLGPDGFVCPHFKECRTSARKDGATFAEGQLSHVGKHYDLFIGDQPLRVMVVGQEYGASRPLIDLDERYHQITRSGRFLRYKTDGVHPERNPHMRGTTSALRVLFGNPLGTDYEGEFIATADGPVHVFDAMALVNRLLCSAHERGSSQGRSTRTMRDNCLEHFEATLAVLEPTVMILQGINVGRWLASTLKARRQIAPSLSELELPSGRTLVCEFTHPSARGAQRWGDTMTRPYLTDVVEPTLVKVREMITGS
jgi:hypothetical protein